MALPGSLNIANYEQLLNQLGIGGSNPARPLDRWSQVLQGMLAIQQGQHGLSLEPQRQAQLGAFLANINPANIQARIDSLFRQNRGNAALRQSMDAASNPGMNPAALTSYNARADMDTAREAQSLRSPESRTGAYGSMLNAISTAQNPQLAMILSQLQGNMQQSNMMAPKKDPLGGFGGLLGTVGQLAGMGAFGNIFGGGGGGGGSSPAPTGGSNTATGGYQTPVYWRP